MPSAPLKLLVSGHGGIAAVALVAVTVITSAAVAKRAAGPSADGEMTVKDSFSGLVRPNDVSSITTPTAITVAEVVVVVGEELAAGQPIARLDQTDGERDLAQLGLEIERARLDVLDRERDIALVEQETKRMAVEAAEAAAQLALAEREVQGIPVRQAKDSPERAELTHEQAVQRMRRLEQLAAAGLVAKQEVEDAQFTVRVAADDLANARRAADAETRVHSAGSTQARARRDLSLADQRRQLAVQQAELQQARIRLKQVQLKYDASRQILADPLVRAPRAGAVMELIVHSGDRLSPGALVARMAALDPIAVDIDVPPPVANTLHTGDGAHVDLPAVGIARREAHVVSIGPLPGDDGKYPVRLALPNPDHARLAGQTSRVTFDPIKFRR